MFENHSTQDFFVKSEPGSESGFVCVKAVLDRVSRFSYIELTLKRVPVQFIQNQ
jgi:hypothetical protein